MPKLRSQTESGYVQTAPDGNCLGQDFRALQNWYFLRSCPDYRALKRPYVQTFVHSKLPMSRFSCAPKLIICEFVSRLPFVQNTLCPDFPAFEIAYVQTFMCSKSKFERSKIYNCLKNLLIFYSSLFCILFVNDIDNLLKFTKNFSTRVVVLVSVSYRPF